MPFHDLNVAYTADIGVLNNLVLFAQELEYTTVALAVSITGKLPPQPPIIPIGSELAISIPANLTVLTRLTLTISDTAQNHRLSTLASTYDIVALRPTSEKTLQQCCLNLECDLISIDFSQRLHYPLKFSPAAAALQRGVRFEICYSPGILAGNDARRNLISGATQLIRATRGRGIIISSEAKNALALRGPWDVMNLAQVWGLAQERAKEAVCEEPGKVIRLARIKRTSFRGVVDIIDGGSQVNRETTSGERPTSNGIAPTQAGVDSNSPATAMKNGQSTTVNNGKRKASALYPKSNLSATSTEEQGLSKRELKRRAKKVKLEGKSNSNIPKESLPESLPIQHETKMVTDQKTTPR